MECSAEHLVESADQSKKRVKRAARMAPIPCTWASMIFLISTDSAQSLLSTTMRRTIRVAVV